MRCDAPAAEVQSVYGVQGRHYCAQLDKRDLEPHHNQTLGMSLRTSLVICSPANSDPGRYVSAAPDSRRRSHSAATSLQFAPLRSQLFLCSARFHAGDKCSAVLCSVSVVPANANLAAPALTAVPRRMSDQHVRIRRPGRDADRRRGLDLRISICKPSGIHEYPSRAVAVVVEPLSRYWILDIG